VKSPVFSSFLSTPSARRATVSHNDPDYLLRISIHALREEGDADLPPDHDHRTISIHALREEGDLSLSEARDQVRLISIHALREEGDLASLSKSAKAVGFLSTPSARRATCAIAAPKDRHSISIHALREEGDLALTLQKCGRPVFLSTPSARRATLPSCWKITRRQNFYPRPPRGGRRCTRPEHRAHQDISIHALREEGDLLSAL